MIRKFFALLFLFSLASCATFSPLPLLADLEMDFPIEDPDNISEGTIEVHSIEMSVGGSIGIDESFSTGLTFGIRGSGYYEARFSDSNEIWFSENKRITISQTQTIYLFKVSSPIRYFIVYL